jgi:hypothetical protein
VHNAVFHAIQYDLARAEAESDRKKAMLGMHMRVSLRGGSMYWN